MKEQLIIIFGGPSKESFVSIASAQNLASYIKNPICWFWDKDGKIKVHSKDNLLKHKSDFMSDFNMPYEFAYSNLTDAINSIVDANVVVVNALHGIGGEDGYIQKLFEYNNILYTGSNANCCRIAFNKIKAKQILQNFGASVAQQYKFLSNSSDLTVLELKEFYCQWQKIIIKPISDGSSVGLYVISNMEELDNAINKLNEQKQTLYMAEQFIDGDEITVGVFEDKNKNLRALPCTQIKKDLGRNFDYDGKYLAHGIKEITPAEIDAKVFLQAQNLAIKAHKLLGCYGYSRTDMIFDGNKMYFLEINTLPGLTKASLIPQQLQSASIAMNDFIMQIIELAKKKKE